MRCDFPGTCDAAEDVLLWQLAATLEPTRERAAAVSRADEALESCRRCIGAVLIVGSEEEPCALGDTAAKYTELGPDFENPTLLHDALASDRIQLA